MKMLQNIRKINKIISPLTGKENVEIERSICTRYIREKYFNELNINVDRFFKDIDEIYICKCKDTGYRFYYPFSIEADNELYKDLQNIDWYYSEWKWEHEIAKRLIKPSDKVLEIGCANGNFLSILKKNKIESSGLEINENAIYAARERGIDVLNETIQQHSFKNKNKYNVVCSFQVMEHLSDVYSAVKASCDCLAINGNLIISLPNNDSYLKWDENTLNMPPHHMGLWNEKSLKSFENIFHLKLLDLHFEPMNEENKYFENVISKYFKSKFKIPLNWSVALFPHLKYVFGEKFLAFTMLVNFQKIN
jgi:SAM-dependent methyltransferase